MSGMKFRVQCSSCGTTFFSPDRKTRLCPKCVKKRSAAPQSATPRPAGRPGAQRQDAQRQDARTQDARGNNDRPRATRPEPKPKQPPRPVKAAEITPEQTERLEQLYQERLAGTEQPWPDIVKAISDELWVKRNVVAYKLRKIIHPDVAITPELQSQIIEMYKGYVERGERPPGGRRKTIAHMLGVPFTQVRSILYNWSLTQYQQAGKPEIPRETGFAIEKRYWSEIEAQRYTLKEMPAKIAEQLEGVTSYQVMRWLDMLHDDDERFANVPDASPEIEARIIAAYQQYLTQPAPPEKGLHATIAKQIGGITTKLVHKTLQNYRKRRRAEYPLPGSAGILPAARA